MIDHDSERQSLPGRNFTYLLKSTCTTVLPPLRTTPLMGTLSSPTGPNVLKLLLN